MNWTLTLRRCLLFSVIFNVAQTILALENIPVVQTQSREVVILHDGLVVSWHLEPANKPDVYTIGNNLQAHAIKVITDIDSLDFELSPGQSKDFILQYRDSLTCYTRFAAMPNPVFFDYKVAVSFALCVLLLFSFLYYRRKLVSNEFLLTFGAIAAGLFWTMTLVGGILHKNYSHITMGVSELGTIGTVSEVFMALFSMSLAVCCLLFSIGFLQSSKALKISQIPAYLSFLMVVSMAWGATFPSGNSLHGLLGPLPLAIMLGALLAFLLWPAVESYSRIRKMSLLSFVVMLLFVLRFVPFLQWKYEGLIQRFLWLGWSIWYTALSFYLRKTLKDGLPGEK